MAKNWIAGAVSHPGVLTTKAKSAGAVGKGGKIKRSWLEAHAKGNDTTAKQARLALTFRKMN